MARITNVIVDWMEDWGNNPRFKVEFDSKRPEWPALADPVWESREGLHRADTGCVVRYFYTDGKPTHRSGGAEFAGTFQNGTPFKYIGAWSSRAGCINMLYPESRVVDVTSGMRALAVTAEALIAWWLEAEPEWGLAWCYEADGECVLQPTRNGKVKNPELFARIGHIER